jgi:hypothetical protein
MADQLGLFPEMEVEGLLKKLARARKRAGADVPTMVARVEVEQGLIGQSYEEANWATLSPQFRKVHNQLRRARGMAAIPEPLVDRYVPPALRKFDKIDEHSPEAVAAMRQFLSGGGTMRIPGHEGFEDRGVSRASWIDP